MASIEKRTTDEGTSYRVKIRLKGFPPESATFERMTDAKTWAAKTESDMKAGRHFGETKRHTFAELADEYAPQAKDKERLAYWREVFGADRLDTITPARIAKERDKLLAGDTKKKDAATGEATKRTGSTVNRYLAALSVALSHGVKELQWLERNTMERVTKPAESKGRVRFLSDDERTRLLEACRPHADLYLAVVLSLTTGARQTEVMTLRFGQVDFARQVITLHDTKNGERRALPLVGEAFTLLQDRAKVRSLTDDRIFPPVRQTKTAPYINLRHPWEMALKEAGITDFHWHDLRHTAASYLAMSGVSLVEIAKVLGHRTLQMVARYSHLSDGHIVATGEKLAARLGVGK
jgi:integrase